MDDCDMYDDVIIKDTGESGFVNDFFTDEKGEEIIVVKLYEKNPVLYPYSAGALANVRKEDIKKVD